MSEARHHVVVVGAGFGGLELTRALSGGPVRITKVDKALKHIEQKVEALVAAFGDEIQKYRALHPDRQQAGAVEDKSSDAALLNGPQMPDDAAKQAEIDALLASFD